jgi:hypothetical protein
LVSAQVAGKKIEVFQKDLSQVANEISMASSAGQSENYSHMAI